MDENLPAQVAQGLTLCTYRVHAVGDPGAPPRESTDEQVVQWCIDRRAVLITLDRGRKNPEMLALIRARNVRVILAPRGTAARDVVRLFANRHDRIEDDARRGRACRYRLGSGGRLSRLYVQEGLVSGDHTGTTRAQHLATSAAGTYSMVEPNHHGS